MKGSSVLRRRSAVRKEVTHDDLGSAGRRASTGEANYRRRNAGSGLQPRGEASGGGDPGSAGRAADARSGGGDAGGVVAALLPIGSSGSAGIIGVVRAKT